MYLKFFEISKFIGILVLLKWLVLSGFFFWFQNIVHMMGSFQKLPFFSHSTDSSRKSRISSIVSVGAPTDDARGPGGYETRPERDTYEPRP